MNRDIIIPNRLVKDTALEPTDWLVYGVVVAHAERRPLSFVDEMSDDESATISDSEIASILKITPEIAGLSVRRLLELNYLEGRNDKERVLFASPEEVYVFDLSTKRFRLTVN